MQFIWPQLVSRVNGDLLRVRGVVRPSPITARYDVQIECPRYGPPIVRVVSPILTRRATEPDTPIPHTYDAATPGQERPCLFFHPEKEWSSAKPIATTVMPWLLSWLVDYELWHATGEWFGGGMPHAGSPKVDGAAEAA